MSTSTPNSIVIAPLPWTDSEPFWQATSRGELYIQRCPDTGRYLFPPTPRSPFGTHRQPVWEQVSGRGRIWSYIVAHPPLIGQFAAWAPYVSVLVELEEDSQVRLPGLLISESGALPGPDHPTTMRIGDPVWVDLTESAGDYVVPRWSLVEPR